MIDIEESTSLLGSGTVKSNTPEYECANEIYTLLNLVKMLMSIFHKKDFVYVGNIDSGIQFNLTNNT